MTELFHHAEFADHESVHFFRDAETGLRAIIAVHSTVLGPATGGCRYWRYAREEDAVTDVLRLSHGMSLKCALAGLDLGGGKAVIIADDATDADKPAVLRAFGRAVDSLGGRYYTAEDVGVGVADLVNVQKETGFVAGLAAEQGASGDPSPVTAKGVYLGMKVAARHKFHSDSLKGRTVIVQGVGQVGRVLCSLLHEEGVKLVVTDVNDEAVASAVAAFDARAVAPDEIYEQEGDIFAPCALGAAINERTIGRIKAHIIAGSANNQLASPVFGRQLLARGILYAPDYIVNAGGIINIASEIAGRYDPAWAEKKLNDIPATLDAVLIEAREKNLPTNEVADARAMDIIKARRDGRRSPVGKVA